VSIGDVFARAWDLWRRDVGWLILAGLVIGLIMVVILAITYGIAGAVTAGAVVGSGSLGRSSSGLGALGVGLGVAAVLYVVAMFFVQVVAMTFYGGLFEMVIGSYRQQRDVVFGDLFSGFRKFGSYVVYALVLFGISIGLGLLNFLPLIGPLIALCVSLWVSIIWLYVLPLIADHGLSFMDAARKSSEMVKSAGWWWTFFKVILLGLAAAVALAIIVLIARGAGHASGSAGAVTGILLFLVFAVLFPPYAICYVSVLYIGSGGDIETVPAGGGMGVSTVPPAPPAPPAYGTQPYETQGYGAAPYGTPAAPVPAPPASADAWKAAADPLASAPPPAPPLASAGQTPSPAAPSPTAAPAPAGTAPADDATAVTQAPPASEAPPAGPEAPEAPPPPPPPVT